MKVLLVDDHAIVRDGLRRLLATLGGEEVVDAADGREALVLARSLRPDLAIVDLNLPGLGGLELIRRLAQDAPETRILVLSMHAEPLYVTRAMDAGAHGYLSKNVAPDELLAAVRKVAAGGRYVEGEVAQALAVRAAEADEPMGKLSPRDLEMLRLLAQGRSLAEIADSLGIGYKTVANSFTSIKAKLGVARTADLVRLALELGVG
jgi:two-component system, NarL family, invasion response regulator UvrY